MKVIFLIPAGTGSITTHCHQSLVAVYRLLNESKIPYDEFMLENCPYLPMARNSLIAMAMGDPEGTDFFFIDQDVKFPAKAVVDILQRPEGIVAGIYPLKRDEPGFPVIPTEQDGVPVGRDGLINAQYLPTGFMRIKRICIESMMKAYPELQYDDSVVEVQGLKVTGMYDFFHQGIDRERQRWTGEDYSFCKRWRDIGGQLWIYPNIDFGHVGVKQYRGNYHDFLLRCPGGRDAPGSKTAKAVSIDGWMTSEELAWLAEQAEKHFSIVELGSNQGRSTRVLGDNTPGKVWAIDDWNGSRELRWTNHERNSFYEKFASNLSDLIAAEKVIPVRINHASVESFPGVHPDMVFIDGDHSYEGCKGDILRWRERMQPGGLLCGHDADWPGVQQAISELLPSAAIAPGTKIWYAELK